MTANHREHDAHHDHKHNHHAGMIVSLAGSFAAMYLAMYAMADRWEHVYFNLSNVWMTGLMTAAMSVPMLFAMGMMLPTARAKTVAWALIVVLGLASWFLLRAEAGVGDRQFLRAMIPHHSAAIQMCNESEITDPRIKKLCAEIVSSQEREIAQMKSLLAESK
jgi:uncharacterized protein (DUF305 family)